MVYEYQKMIKKFELTLSKNEMTIDFYKEMCQLFEWVTLIKSTFDDSNLFEMNSIRLIDSIAYTFQTNLDIERLLHVYPMELRSHIQFYLINELNLKRDVLGLLIELFEKEYIQHNEWVDSDWNTISKLYRYCIGEAEFPIFMTNKNTREYLLNVLKEKNISFLQQLWIKIFLEELDGKR